MPKPKQQNTAEPAAPAEAPGRSGGPRAPWLTAAIIVATLLLVAGGWFVYTSLGRPATPEPDRAELSAIDTRLSRIQDAIRPIATALAAQTSNEASGVIDVALYRVAVARVRELVDSINDLPATSADALEIRDLVLTGGSQVVAGLDQSLDALAGDDAKAAEAAAVHVEEGLGNLQTARRRLDVALGRASGTDAV